MNQVYSVILYLSDDAFSTAFPRFDLSEFALPAFEDVEMEVEKRIEEQQHSRAGRPTSMVEKKVKDKATYKTVTEGSQLAMQKTIKRGLLEPSAFEYWRTEKGDMYV